MTRRSFSIPPAPSRPAGTTSRRWCSPDAVTLDRFYLQDRALGMAGRATLAPTHRGGMGIFHPQPGVCTALGHQDGSYHEGENLRLSDRDQPDKLDPPIASFPPDPQGFHDMAGGFYEGVPDRAPSDPAEVRIDMGGNTFSTILREVIPTRGVAQPLPEAALEQLPDAMALPAIVAGATGRSTRQAQPCAASRPSPTRQRHRALVMPRPVRRQPARPVQLYREVIRPRDPQQHRKKKAPERSSRRLWNDGG